MSYKGIENLRNAIILQAVKDLKSAYKALKKDPDSMIARAKTEYEEKFFRSRWYRILTSIDGEAVLLHLREEADL